jgi:hypothetical protein
MPNLLPVDTQTVVEKPIIAAEAEPGITNSKSRGLPYFSSIIIYFYSLQKSKNKAFRPV